MNNIEIGLSCAQCFTSLVTVCQKLLCWPMTTGMRVGNYVVKQLWPRHTCAAATKFSCFRVLTQGPSSADRCLFSCSSFSHLKCFLSFQTHFYLHNSMNYDIYPGCFGMLLIIICFARDCYDCCW